MRHLHAVVRIEKKTKRAILFYHSRRVLLFQRVALKPVTVSAAIEQNRALGFLFNTDYCV